MHMKSLLLCLAHSDQYMCAIIILKSRFIEIYFTYHIIHPFRCIAQWFLLWSQICTAVTTVHFRALSLLHKEALIPLSSRPPSLCASTTKQTLTYFFSL